MPTLQIKNRYAVRIIAQFGLGGQVSPAHMLKTADGNGLFGWQELDRQLDTPTGT
jgi:hypothetical protein